MKFLRWLLGLFTCPHAFYYVRESPKRMAMVCEYCGARRPVGMDGE